MKYVKQEDYFGCGPAVIAMILGWEYRQAADAFLTNFEIEGIDYFVMCSLLAEHGFATAPKFPHYAPAKKSRDIWPVLPFAPMHMVQVSNKGKYSHMVAMDHYGTIFDPADKDKIHIIDYPSVYLMIGVMPITVAELPKVVVGYT